MNNNVLVLAEHQTFCQVVESKYRDKAWSPKKIPAILLVVHHCRWSTLIGVDCNSTLLTSCHYYVSDYTSNQFSSRSRVLQSCRWLNSSTSCCQLSKPPAECDLCGTPVEKTASGGLTYFVKHRSSAKCLRAQRVRQAHLKDIEMQAIRKTMVHVNLTVHIDLCWLYFI
jgi:hypothetical protein